MQKVTSIGTPLWSRSEIIVHLDEFESIYSERPIKDNHGGIKAPHMFAIWFMAKKLCPDLIVESGIYKGQSTWLLEKACPDAKLISIDIDLGQREYISERAIYSSVDFSEHDWTAISDRSLVFFDDHQNAYKRLQQCKWFGFKHIIFDDNYPAIQGDCYSLKKAFSNSGFGNDGSKWPGNNVFSRIIRRVMGFSTPGMPQYEAVRVLPNEFDSVMLKKQLDVYYEFPPVYKSKKTRWGDEWSDEIYFTPQPLTEDFRGPTREIFRDEVLSYTWLCYAKLKQSVAKYPPPR